MAKRDLDAMLAAVTDDVVWDIVDKRTKTKDGFENSLDLLHTGNVALSLWSQSQSRQRWLLSRDGRVLSFLYRRSG